ncbi:fasciclin domain-containing protein, partial [Rhabdobacter roseus]
RNGQRAATLQGEEVEVAVFGNFDLIKVNNSNVVLADVEASNGLIHVIDEVLLPPMIMMASVGRISIENVYPNPVVDRLNISVTTPQTTELKLSLYRGGESLTPGSGQLFRQQRMEVASGASLVDFDTSNIPAGVYILHLETGSTRKVVRIVKR